MVGESVPGALCGVHAAERGAVGVAFLPPFAAADMAMFPAAGLGTALRLLLRQHRSQACAIRMLKTTCSKCSEVLASPRMDDAPKEYSPKIQQLVQDIANLTLLEISDLNELLKKTLKIQDIGLMPMAGMMPATQLAAPAEEEEEVEKVEKVNFTVRLTGFKAEDKVKVIKEIKNHVENINLVQAKKLVESLPQDIKVNVRKEEAEKIKSALEAVGGTVVVD